MNTLVKALRIALIVDHPLRDLPGLALIAKSLAQKGAEVFLTPMYSQDREVLALAPDYVLLNYLRRNNQLFVQRGQAAGIQFGISETEGGFYSDLKIYGGLFSDQADIYKKLRGNFVWGQKVHDFLKNQFPYKHDLTITGLPRFDFYSPKYKNTDWSHFLSSLPSLEKPMFLINTKVAIYNPLFLSREKEIDLYKNKLGFTDEQINHYLTLGKASIEDNLETAKKLSERYADHLIVLRPHPHENEKAYEGQIASSNFSVHKEGPVIPWILHSKAVIHRHCTTAVEAALAGVPPIAPQWMRTSAAAPDAEEVSYRPQTESEFHQLLAQADKNNLPLSEQATNSIQRIVDDWLFKMDGESHTRVADGIFNAFDSTQKVNKDLAQKQFFNIYNQRQDLFGKSYHHLNQLLPKQALWALEKVRLNKWQSSQKFFTLGDVKSWMKVAGGSDLKVDWARPEQDYMLKYPGCSVKVSL